MHLMLNQYLIYFLINISSNWIMENSLCNSYKATRTKLYLIMNSGKERHTLDWRNIGR